MAKFQDYKYNPTDPDVVAKVQADIPEFNFTCPDIEKLIRYTIYVYDPHGDMKNLYPGDFMRRKNEAAKLAGFELVGDRFPGWAEDCFVGASDDYNAALVAYVTSFNIADLTAFVMYKEIFFTEFQAAMKAPDSKMKKEAMANAEIARNRLTELERRIFTDEETLSVRNALYVVAERMKLNLRPESMARAIDAKNTGLPDPYYPKRGRGRPKKQADV